MKRLMKRSLNGRVKRIPSSVVSRYIELDAENDLLKEELSRLQTKLRNYYKAGFESSLLRFQPSTTWRPDWRKLVDELTSKYMTPGQKRVYFRNLTRRYPRRPVAETIVIIGKERKKKSAAASVEG